MFDAFEVEQNPEHVKRLTGATMAALAVLGASLVAIVAFGNSHANAAAEKKVDVSFRPPPPPPERAEPPPPPPPPPRPKPKVVAEAAPAPGPAAMVAPTEVPKAPPPESDKVVEAIQVAVGGKGDGKAPAVEAPAPDADESEAPVVASAATHGPVNLPEDADPPEPDEGNLQPDYPESARATGQEARVVLKIVVELDGHVGRIQVLKGEEPFTSVAIAAVKQWKYEPAKLEGQPIVVFKIVDLKFRIRE